MATIWAGADLYQRQTGSLCYVGAVPGDRLHLVTECAALQGLRGQFLALRTDEGQSCCRAITVSSCYWPSAC